MRQDPTATSVEAENARLRALLDGINAIVWTYDPGRALFTSINQYASVLLGYPLEDWLSRPNFWLERVVHPDDQRWTGDFCAAATSRREDHAFEYRAVCADGRVLWVRDVVRVLPDAERGVILHGVMHDVTAAKQIEASLRTSELQFRQIAEHIPAVVWLTDPATEQLLFVSPRFEEVWGLPRAELQRDPHAWLRAVHPADREWVAAVAQSMEEREIEFRIVRPDGQERWVVSRRFGIRNDDGAVYRFAGIARDITEQKQSELALRESHEALARSEARFRSLIENASDMITVLSPQGDVLYQSPAVLRLLGYTPAERLHANTFELVHPDDQPAMRAAMQSVLRQPGASAVVRVRYRHADGSYRQLEGRGRNLLHDPAVGGLVINTRDVTEQVHLETQLRQAQKMEAVGRLAGGIAHDFNNLLSVIQGHADLLRDTLGSDRAASEDVQQIRDAAQRAASLTRQLLAFSRRQVMQPALVDADRMLHELEKMLRRLIGEHVELQLQLGAAGKRIHIDVGQFEQVVINLVINARDALGEGGRIVIATDTVVRPVSDAEGGLRDFLRLRVSDSGPGIAADVLPHIFEPFFTTKEVGKGTGLGLATVYAIVDGAGGSLEVTTGQGDGTTFFVYLPSHGGVSEAPTSSEAAVTQQGSETILLVEDESAVRALGRRVLQRLGYRVLEAGDGVEALQRLESNRSVDLVITDVVMPRMGGRELGERLRSLRPALPVLYVSGYPVDAANEPASWPSELYLEKPFDPAALARAVRRALDS